ncbi:hypothetical protein D1223_01535 [Henriciella mobilis]|uniref:DUF4398 domain-containing protein n=2 Tax=Henriciella mobilis TaxID=2305467 RepID=A0A399RQF8_9PROT|nr:hypothetical protein D1223_01535 [Henriciella mobilis]
MARGDACPPCLRPFAGLKKGFEMTPLRITAFATLLAMSAACASAPEPVVPADPVERAELKVNELEARLMKAEKDLVAARKDVDEARERVKKAENRLAEAKGDVTKAETKVQQAKKALDKARVDLGDELRKTGVTGSADN